MCALPQLDSRIACAIVTEAGTPKSLKPRLAPGAARRMKSSCGLAIYGAPFTPSRGERTAAVMTESTSPWPDGRLAAQRRWIERGRVERIEPERFRHPRARGYGCDLAQRHVAVALGEPRPVGAEDQRHMRMSWL